MSGIEIPVQHLIVGDAVGDLLCLTCGLSFWGGVDTVTGEIVDGQHPQRGQNISGRMLVLPEPRGSTAAPGALLECILAGVAPAGIVLASRDVIPIAAILAGRFIGLPSIPVARLRYEADLRVLQSLTHARLLDDRLTAY